MNELQKKLEEIAFSKETYEKIIKIGDKHNLMIDLQGELSAEIRDILLGSRSSKNFVKDIQERLEINIERANAIAIDVNAEIFEAIKDKLQQVQAQNEAQESNINQNSTPIPSTPTPAEVNQMISSVEKAGDFKIENTEPQSSSPQYKEENINREELLKGIEDPPTPAAPPVSPDAPVPLVDHLLTTPVNNPQIAEVRKVETAKPEDKKTYSADPYREQIS